MARRHANLQTGPTRLISTHPGSSHHGEQKLFPTEPNFMHTNPGAKNYCKTLALRVARAGGASYLEGTVRQARLSRHLDSRDSRGDKAAPEAYQSQGEHDHEHGCYRAISRFNKFQPAERFTDSVRTSRSDGLQAEGLRDPSAGSTSSTAVIRVITACYTEKPLK